MEISKKSSCLAGVEPNEGCPGLIILTTLQPFNLQRLKVPFLKDVNLLCMLIKSLFKRLSIYLIIWPVRVTPLTFNQVFKIFLVNKYKMNNVPDLCTNNKLRLGVSWKELQSMVRNCHPLNEINVQSRLALYYMTMNLKIS